jgi:DNA invertase Pin-like site-specific DNA recombinase
MTVAAYLRVSSRSQNAATQQEAIRVASHARGQTVTRWYFEAQSGKTRDRPEIKTVIEDARRGEITRLWVFRLDRLTRSGIRDTLNLLEELNSSGCQVISVADGFGLDGPFADVVLAVIAWAAQMERVAIGDRIAAARVRVEAAGRTWGRPNRLLTTEQRVTILAMATDKKPIRLIAQTVRVPKSTIQRFLASTRV